MQPIPTLLAQSEMGATEIIPTLFVIFGLLTGVTFIVLLLFSIKLKSHQLAGLNFCLCIGVGVLLQPWSEFLAPTPDSPVTFWSYVRLISWALAMLIATAVFLFNFVKRKKYERRPRRRRVTRSTRR
jgi:apolipoprotein N-acyltransferase